jgi:uncharacterized protein (TIGR02246 family)
MEMDKAADRTGIVALAQAIERAWNAGDVKSYARLYALDAYVTRAGILWKGRKAIERGHAAAFRGELKGTVLKIRVKRLRFLTAKNAVAHCGVELSGGARQRARKIYAVARFELRKKRARWEIVAARTREISARRK